MPRRVLVHPGETADFAGAMRESGHGNRLKCDSCEVSPEEGGSVYSSMTIAFFWCNVALLSHCRTL